MTLEPVYRRLVAYLAARPELLHRVRIVVPAAIDLGYYPLVVDVQQALLRFGARDAIPLVVELLHGWPELHGRRQQETRRAALRALGIMAEAPGPDPKKNRK